ncbi:MAG: hypothetical protein SVP52_06560, partial [Chloroflexota bacterium]|nr:hypothetical protein [Chloroflexota bacterium]
MVHKISLDMLRKISLFQDFMAVDLLEIQKLLHYQAVEKDDILLLEGGFSNQLIFVKSGWFKSEKTSKEGRQQTLRFIG